MRIRYFFLIAVSGLFFTDCRQEQPADDYTVLEGQTMGTYYRITYQDEKDRDFQSALDSLFVRINLQVSTYIDSSVISRFNQSADGLDLGPADAEANDHFLVNLVLAREVYERSGGAFDPTVMPLVNYWGFGYTGKDPIRSVDSLKVDSLLEFVGFDKVELISRDNRLFLKKQSPGTQLDFSACAKGYAVDEAGRFLEKHGISNYLVDIGGEARGRGQNPKGAPWNIGINKPVEGAPMNEIETAAPLKDLSVATSGNYRNFYEVDGRKFSHTINPITGFPERTTLLSSSVFYFYCITADAYATAFMVLGLERAMALAEELPDIEAFFIYAKPDGALGEAYTSGAKAWFEKQTN